MSLASAGRMPIRRRWPATQDRKERTVAVFIVKLEHPDEEGWRRWLEPHLNWVKKLVDAGVIVASGPSLGTSVRQGLLVMQAVDEPALREVLKTDPFWPNGIIENLTVVQWDPIFGRLASCSSAPDGIRIEMLTP